MQELDDLMALAAWMREVGATRVCVRPDGSKELELGPAPLPTSGTFRGELDRELERDTARNELRDELNTRFAHVGGWTGTDEQLDAMVEAGATA